MAIRTVTTRIFLAAALSWSAGFVALAEELPPLPSGGLELDFEIPEPPQDLSVYDGPRPLTEMPVERAREPGGLAHGERPTVVVRPPGALAERRRRQREWGTAEADPVPAYARLPELRYSTPAHIAGGYLDSRPVVSSEPMDPRLADEEARLLAEAARRRLEQEGTAGVEAGSPALRRIVLIAEVDDPLAALARFNREGAEGEFVDRLDLELPKGVADELERYEGKEITPETTLELVETVLMTMRRSGRQVSEVRIVEESLARGEVALMVVEPQA